MSSVDSFYSLSARDIYGRDVPFAQYKGRVCMVVNTASKGLNQQKLKELQRLQDRYLGKAFQLLVFPCNQFFFQESKRNEKIRDKYLNKLNLSLQLFQRVDVNGKRTHPVYQWLKSRQTGALSKRIEDNFVKFIIEPDGETVYRLSPALSMKETIKIIEKCLLKCDGSAKVEVQKEVFVPPPPKVDEMAVGKKPTWPEETPISSTEIVA